MVSPSPAAGFPIEPVIERLSSRAGIQKVPTPKLTLFMRKGFLDTEFCTELMAIVDRDRRPSLVSDYNGDDVFRTSETCDLPADNPATQRLDAMICDFIGLDPAHGEPLQGQRYAVGQEFKAHTDYFEPTGVDFEKFCAVAGQRTWTVMIYLNAVEAGGATRFKAIDKLVQPEPGKLLAWSNLRPNGTPNPSTLHHAMKVRAGTKYVITKWFRERPWG
ncbi:MAG: oxygenase [Sphingomonas sp. 32-66-10]|nr:MAG: oxygenase [Sphingomonas sp. 32-66-10]